MMPSMAGLAGKAEWVALAYLANALWQVPLVFAGAWAGARLARKTGAAVEHRIWVMALMLEAGLPGVRLDLRAAWAWVVALFSAWFAAGAGAHESAARVLVGAVAADPTGGFRLSPEVLSGAALLFAGAVAYGAGRLIWGVRRTEAMRRHAALVVPDGPTAAAWRRFGGQLRHGFAAKPQLRRSREVCGPVTVGVLRPAVLLPPDWLQNAAIEDTEAVFAHELAHVRRWDFAKNLFYKAISLAVAWHPVVWMTRARLAESREMICDAMAAEAVAGHESYARSLLRLAAMVADRASAKTLHAIGIFDANSFERRVMNLTKRRVEMRWVQRLGALAAGALIVLATCAAALALRIDVGPEMQAVAAASGADPLKVKQDDLKSAYKKPPVYPAEARAKKNTIDGSVVLAVVIAKDGTVAQIQLKKSLREDYDRSALDAVKDWRWEPYLLNGEPTEVDTTVTVTYTLQPENEEKPKTQAAAAPPQPDKWPKLISQVSAAYPEKARADKEPLNASVVVGLTVGTDGGVKETHIEHGFRSDFDESALNAISRYRFEPAFAGGRPVDSKLQIQIDFHMY